MNPGFVAAIATVFLLVALGKKKAAEVVSTFNVGSREWTADDHDILARILTTETGGDETHAATGVAWVVVNRAIAKNKSIREVVLSESFTGAGERAAEYRLALTQGSGYKSPKFGYLSPVDRYGYAKSVQLATDVLSGKRPSPIGDCNGYTHPKNFKNEGASLTEGEKNAVTAGRLVWYRGKLCPDWNVPKDAGGKASVVVEIGDARFSK